MSAVAALVLAAGRGTRFGEAPKLLAEWRGKPLIRHVAEMALASCARPVSVVLGHEGQRIARALDGLALCLVENPDFAAGLSTSLKAGFAALPSGSEAAIVLLGDMPGIETTVIDALIAAWEEGGRPVAAVPTHEGRRGNPVLLSRTLASEIAQLAGDRGAGPLLAAREDVLEVPLAMPNILIDIDTPAALTELRGR